MAHRPLFDDWALRFYVVLDEEMLSTKLFRLIVDDAGKRVGLGEIRPAKKGPYGKYTVVKWREEKLEPILREAAE